MTLSKLFKVLVVGGTGLVSQLGCVDDTPGQGTSPLDSVDAGQVDAGPDGVSGWLSWFEPLPDASPPDAAQPDAGVSGWLHW